MINEKILRSEEKAVFALRALYSSFGYAKYKMSKFEEYDLYVRNKDFLISDGIITFTDTNGKLMALKPDVTLSIIKNSTDGEGVLQKLYYNENVYRISGDSHSFKEITQTGLECIGDVGLYEVCEVVYLALKSLETIDRDFIMDISHAGLASALLGLCGAVGETKARLITHIQNKSADEIRYMAKKGEITTEGEKAALLLTKSYTSVEDLKAALAPYEDNAEIQKHLTELCAILGSIGNSFKDKLFLDFSLISGTSYYSGALFKGYIKGIPTAVLSGGQYDTLMKRMGKKASAVGFAVYLDMLERHGDSTDDDGYDFVILKDEASDPAEIIKTAEAFSEKGLSVIVLTKLDPSIKYKSLIKFTKDGLEGA